MMEDEVVHYPYLRREVIGSFGEVKFSLVDIRDGQVVASWVEREEGAVWGEDCYNSVDENENYSEPGEEGRRTDPFSVYVGNLDPWATKEDVVRHFSVVGEILRVTLLRSKKMGVRVGSAFVRFSERGAAERALFLEGSYLLGTMIIVREKLLIDKDVDVNEDPDFDPLSIYIGNLDHSVTSLDLASTFHEVGEIDKVTVLMNKETGEHKGAAYVQFKDLRGLKRALDLDGCFVAGKNIRVKRKRKTTGGGEDTNNNKRARIDLSEEEEASPAHDLDSVFVGNIDVGTRRYDLEDHFKSTGDIVRVSILKTNKAAYIQFKDPWSVEGALCMDGTMLKDKVIRVRRKKLKNQ